MRKLMIVVRKLSKNKSPISRCKVSYFRPVYVDAPYYIAQSKSLTRDFIKENIKNPPSGEYAVQFVGEYCGISKPLWRANFSF